MYDVSPHLFIATPLPGTRLEKKFIDDNLLIKPLTSEELAAVTQGGLCLDGGTFSAKELTALREYFFSCYRRKFAIKTLWHFLRNPVASVNMLRNMPLIKNKSFKQKLLSLFVIKKAYFMVRG
jgi:hypothetical protein